MQIEKEFGIEIDEALQHEVNEQEKRNYTMKKFISFFGEHSPIFDELNNRAAAYAASLGFEYTWSVQKPFDKEQVTRLLSENDVGLIDVEPYDASIFERIVPRCKLLVRFGVGFDKVNLADATASGIAVARTTGANSTGVAEMALTQILAIRRQLMINRKTVNSGVWVKNVGSELVGATVGIVGFGAIGQLLAQLLQGFKCTILAYDPHPNLERMAELGVQSCSLEEVVRVSDAISIHVPYCPATHHMFDAAVFAQMKKTAVIVCTARGNIIDEDALYDALKNGVIAGAGLDVYATEPLSANSKLIGLDNIILTPHVSSQTVESLWATYKKAIDIAADFYAGRPLSKRDLLNPDYVDHTK